MSLCDYCFAEVIFMSLCRETQVSFTRNVGFLIETRTFQPAET